MVTHILPKRWKPVRQVTHWLSSGPKQVSQKDEQLKEQVPVVVVTVVFVTGSVVVVVTGAWTQSG